MFSKFHMWNAVIIARCKCTACDYLEVLLLFNCVYWARNLICHGMALFSSSYTSSYPPTRVLQVLVILQECFPQVDVQGVSGIHIPASEDNQSYHTHCSG